MLRAHLFLLRAFVTAEDFRLPETMSIFRRVLGELQPEGWASLMHVSTSPKPVLHARDPEVAARGWGDIGTYHMSDALWDEVVGEGVDVERLASEFAPEVSLPPAVLHRRETDPLVEPMLCSLEVGGDGGEGGGGPGTARHVLAFHHPEVLGKGVGHFPLGRFQRHHAPSSTFFVVQLGKHGTSPQCVAVT